MAKNDGDWWRIPMGICMMVLWMLMMPVLVLVAVGDEVWKRYYDV